MALKDIFKDWKEGGEGEGTILFHRKAHRHNGENTDFVCLRGAIQGCEQAYNCSSCFHQKLESYCLKDGQPVGGLLIEEEKHKRLVVQGSYGAHDTLQAAIDFHGKENLFS